MQRSEMRRATAAAAPARARRCWPAAAATAAEAFASAAAESRRSRSSGGSGSSSSIGSGSTRLTATGAMSRCSACSRSSAVRYVFGCLCDESVVLFIDGMLGDEEAAPTSLTGGLSDRAVRSWRAVRCARRLASPGIGFFFGGGGCRLSGRSATFFGCPSIITCLREGSRATAARATAAQRVRSRAAEQPPPPGGG